jgi:hypothetical protein
MARPKKQDASPEASASAPSPPNAVADAFAKVEPELASVAAEALTPITVDIGAAVAAVTAASARIHEHRDAIAEQLPHHPIEHIDNLETYAQAAWYAHLVHTYVSGSPESAKALIDEAQRLREGLLIAAEALAHRGLLNADSVAKIRKGSGTVDMAGDLSGLSALFKESWGKVSSKTAVERTEIDRAAELGPAVLVALHARKNAGKAVDTADQRARAFALLEAAYDSCRRALAYLRWKEGDADAIAPSLHKKRPGRKPGGKKDEEVEGAAAGEAETAG